MMNLTENVAKVKAQVSAATAQAGRPADSVTILAVTKYVDAATVGQLIDLGMTHIGENRVDQFLDKYHQLKDRPVTWHLIGTLQRRKVKDVINLVDYFHALDSIALAQEIQKRADKPVKCFLQVNISEEASKHGFKQDDLEDVLPVLSQLDKISIVGLMTMAPFDATEEELTAIFSKANALRTALQARGISTMPMTDLSMGMSGDFPLAIANGATFVRIGSTFFDEKGGI